MIVPCAPHPLLRFRAFETRFSRPLGEEGSPSWLTRLLASDPEAPLQRSEDARLAIREMLRDAGYKPAGRGKPASEYLARAVEQGKLNSINPAVDACNAVSLHSGLPISVVDLDRAQAPFRIAPCEPGQRYVFNAAGQEIDLAGLICLFDAEGPCASGVKDSQRTKTGPHTRRTLSVVWGCLACEGRLDRAETWYRALLERLGATTCT